eukprot:CAMPEP_0117644132 /NCGR_PEP_ID=MMETSP0802-20121206/10816_1 /TAXON_ID=38833 /ORGANISM="Micromonas sp., Strain CCMP2099" /LENGTH=113 /DNA_ID=CAMNT_0005449349 /DNA_START=86 /DNA_END=427 /DNA_ORIENTATION=+
MSLISRAAHRYSPAIALRLTLIPHVTHHANCLGTPATKQQLTKCATCAVTAKSRHFFARPTTAHNASAIKSDAPTNAATNHRPSVVDVVTREASKKLFVVIFSEPKGGRGVLG